MSGEWTLLVTCEHGGNDVPAPYAAATFPPDLLASHRGWDPGALGIARSLAAAFDAPLLFATTTRLLVDLNRSEHAADLHHPLVPPHLRDRLIQGTYRPHRDAVAAFVERTARTLHVGIHSFVDELGGQRRDVDIGLLFDPDRPAEAAFCRRWLRHLEVAAPHLRHRFNEPYLGIDDGLTTHLRTRHADDHYAGIELELRQGLLTTSADAVTTLLVETLRPAFESSPG